MTLTSRSGRRSNEGGRCAVIRHEGALTPGYSGAAIRCAGKRGPEAPRLRTCANRCCLLALRRIYNRPVDQHGRRIALLLHMGDHYVLHILVRQVVLPLSPYGVVVDQDDVVAGARTIVSVDHGLRSIIRPLATPSGECRAIPRAAGDDANLLNRATTPGQLPLTGYQLLGHHVPANRQSRHG